MTDAELILWNRIRSDLPGRWRRQEPLGRYICDFVCYRYRLVVEVDGDQHAESSHDRRRDAFLHSLGFQTLRFWNDEVYEELDDVLDVIYFAIPGGRDRWATRSP